MAPWSKHKFESDDDTQGHAGFRATLRDDETSLTNTAMPEPHHQDIWPQVSNIDIPPRDPANYDNDGDEAMRSMPTPETQRLYDDMRRIEDGLDMQNHRDLDQLQDTGSLVGHYAPYLQPPLHSQTPTSPRSPSRAGTTHSLTHALDDVAIKEGEPQYKKRYTNRQGPLTNLTRARAALMIKLGACQSCKDRRVACTHFDYTKFEQEYQRRKKRELRISAAPQPQGASPQVGRPRCRHCGQVFQDEAALSAHTKKEHTRPFQCVFHFAGCEKTFAAKNEWKRHVSQHILLNIWICQEGKCSQFFNGTSTSEPPAPKEIFYRKDLFTQHTIRMHMPKRPQTKIELPGQETTSKPYPKDEELRAWEDTLRRYQDRALRPRCKLPEHLICPAGGCRTEFLGHDAWDQCMEHVTRHMDPAVRGLEGNVQFGAPNDEMLVRWASSPEVGIIKMQSGDWVLNLRPSLPPRRKPDHSRASVSALFGTEHSGVNHNILTLLATTFSDGRPVGSSTRIADSGYGSIPTMATREMELDANKSAQLAATNDDTAQTTLETYSTASTLEPNTINAYVSEFVEELRSTLPPNLDREGWNIISPTLGDILKEFSVRIAFEEILADRATCRMIMYMVHKYHRSWRVFGTDTRTCQRRTLDLFPPMACHCRKSWTIGVITMNLKGTNTLI
ncbi:hypothetical protein B0T18DRAFT_57328 [Schizothecium vesticola]|uniref:C2H2-type domain-containing protein n=1 Tax=Schizothecium vesticola TaxID=314040 RepID=A0AA40F3Z5_9PEZI|nr:hypothetical protein B0T18DRAFT_57328 [Schizothecium vesticola]